MKYKINKIADNIMRSAQLAAALEVGGWPKPGNVHRTVDFVDTRFEHFISGAIALGPPVREAAINGMRAGQGKIQINDIKIGKHIKESVIEVKRWHKGGNTHLGISLLFIPLAAAAGMTSLKKNDIESNCLRENVINIMKNTTSKDAMDVYDAIRLASSAALGRLDKEKAPDLLDSESKNELAEQGISLYDVMKISSKWDNVAKEWASGMDICFNTGSRTIIEVYNKTHDINIAIVHTFLTILSTFPDTFIARKIGTKETPYIAKAVEIGIKKIEWITETARQVLKIGGLTTEHGRKAIFDFDSKLQSANGEYNPGTSADLTAGSLMIAFLFGFRF